MTFKICKKCNINKSISEFYVKKKSFTGKCKSCLCIEQQERYSKNKITLQIKKKEYKIKNKESIKEYQKTYTQTQDYKEKRSVYDKTYYNNNKNKIKERHKIYEKYYRNTNLNRRIKCSLRSRIRHALKKTKNCSLENIIECNIDFFKEWLMFQFDEKMSWDNYGTYWQIDHVKPCSLFNLEIIDEQTKCFSWKNCRPLEKNLNNKKSNKYDENLLILHSTIVENYISSLN